MTDQTLDTIVLIVGGVVLVLMIVWRLRELGYLRWGE